MRASSSPHVASNGTSRTERERVADERDPPPRGLAREHLARARAAQALGAALVDPVVATLLRGAGRDRRAAGAVGAALREHALHEVQVVVAARAVRGDPPAELRVGDQERSVRGGARERIAFARGDRVPAPRHEARVRERGTLGRVDREQPDRDLGRAGRERDRREVQREDRRDLSAVAAQQEHAPQRRRRERDRDGDQRGARRTVEEQRERVVALLVERERRDQRGALREPERE
jgi:hypothetical protein